MSTRCRIGLEMPDKTIKEIYCHFDGYPRGVGRVLRRHYTDPDKVAKLMEMGDISVLGTWHDEKLAKMCWDRYNLTDTQRKNLDALTKDMTVDYKSRGEDGVEARTHKDLWAYQEEVFKSDCDYAYVFMTDYSGVYRWHYMPLPYFQPLEDEEDE